MLIEGKMGRGMEPMIPEFRRASFQSTRSELRSVNILGHLFLLCETASHFGGTYITIG